MKSLKFSPEIIDQIKAGEITNTWRLFDDKQLEIGDDIQLINSQTGAVFGYGLV